MCHTMVAGWRGATFDHSKTPFPLTGAHVTVTYAQCHLGRKICRHDHAMRWLPSDAVRRLKDS